MHDFTELVFRPDPDSETHGRLFIRCTSDHYDHPIRSQTYWAASERTSFTNALDYYPELARGPIPLTARPFRPGVYSYHRGFEREIRIIGGGSARAIFNEEERIPEPKTRRGIETRYCRGRWEKYLKTEGWVSA